MGLCGSITAPPGPCTHFMVRIVRSGLAARPSATRQPPLLLAVVSLELILRHDQDRESATYGMNGLGDACSLLVASARLGFYTARDGRDARESKAELLRRSIQLNAAFSGRLSQVTHTHGHTPFNAFFCANNHAHSSGSSLGFIQLLWPMPVCSVCFTCPPAALIAAVNSREKRTGTVRSAAPPRWMELSVAAFARTRSRHGQAVKANASFLFFSTSSLPSFRRRALLRQGVAPGQECGDKAEVWKGMHDHAVKTAAAGSSSVTFSRLPPSSTQYLKTALTAVRKPHGAPHPLRHDQSRIGCQSKIIFPRSAMDLKPEKFGDLHVGFQFVILIRNTHRGSRKTNS
jgi:hypothetical protein